MHLVLGYPGMVARRLVELLIERGEPVAVIGELSLRVIDLEGETSSLGPRSPEGAVVIEGDVRRIDFGLRGEDYAHLLNSIETVWAAVEPESPDSSVETSNVVRVADELLEFVRAGGAPDGVRFLSSLLVFGNATGIVHEDDFQISQGFGDKYERSVALAEKIVRRVADHRELAILRVGPVVGDEDAGQLVKNSPLSRLIESLGAANADVGQVFSDAPARYETVSRAAKALVALPPGAPLRVAHLVDREPMSDRQLAHFLADSLGKMIHESTGGSGSWLKWTRPSYGGSRALRGWRLRFDRRVGEAFFGELLDRDEAGTLEKILRNRESIET